MKHAFTNELIHESSPYLLQHAHNPVEWHSWNDNALAKAIEQDKPILVSIGYAACHWCHVMEKESFENEETARIMNEHFINIKIDREERPDLDHIYMDAVQAIAGTGGWPLNVFLTPDTKPFYGGTYYPPEKAFNRPSWKDVLFYMADAWRDRRQEVIDQAETLLAHINSSSKAMLNIGLSAGSATGDKPSIDLCKNITDNIMRSADKKFGGFGNAPKFPQTFTLQYLLAYSYHFNDADALHHATFSLQQLLKGGIYDHLAGGLARYSTDEQWLAPHFEKMLYDNALLVSVLCDAYQVTGNDIYRQGIDKTLDFFIKEMRHQDGGFYAAVDADSEGIEGKFYVWDKKEIDDILREDAALFCDWYGVVPEGNWEHKNILYVHQDEESFSKKYNISIGELHVLLAAAERKLLAERNKRIPPSKDDKILLGWNALILTAFCKAAAAFGNNEYKEMAVSLYDFLITNFSEAGTLQYHSFKNGKAKHPAYLDDYAYMVQSCILLQEITSDQEYLRTAKDISAFVIENFMNEETGFFFYTNKTQKDIIARKVELYDNAIPSGNSIMAENLFYLSVVYDRKEWWSIANKMLFSIKEIIIKYPTSFAVWALIFLKQAVGTQEIAITGKDIKEQLSQVLKMYLPGKVLQSARSEVKMPLLENREYGDRTLFYLCKNYSCSAPVADFEAFQELLQNNQKMKAVRTIMRQFIRL